jgi:hypothetical protein
MRSSRTTTTLLLFAAVSLSGCGQKTKTADTKTKTAHPHVHEGGDALVWGEEGIKHEGFVIALGHHGKHLHAGKFVEPAIMVTRDGADVADAKVFNSLVASDGKEIIRKEVAAVYEPKSEDEPAHYAQGKLHLPKGSKGFILRFRLVLPGVAEEFVRDIPIEISE